MLLCGIIDELCQEVHQSTAPGLLSYFFCQASSKDINNATAVVRGLLYLLVEQQPCLLSYVRRKYDYGGERLF